MHNSCTRQALSADSAMWRGDKFVLHDVPRSAGSRHSSADQAISRCPIKTRATNALYFVVDRVRRDGDRSRGEQQPAQKHHGPGQHQDQGGGPGRSGSRRDGDPDADHAQHQHGHPGVDQKNGVVQQPVAAKQLGATGCRSGSAAPGHWAARRQLTAATRRRRSRSPRRSWSMARMRSLTEPYIVSRAPDKIAAVVMSTTGATIAWTAVTAIGFIGPAYESSVGKASNVPGQPLQFGPFEGAQKEFFGRVANFRRMRAEVHQRGTVAWSQRYGSGLRDRFATLDRACSLTGVPVPPTPWTSSRQPVGNRRAQTQIESPFRLPRRPLVPVPRPFGRSLSVYYLGVAMTGRDDVG